MTNPVDAPKAGMRIRIIEKAGVSQALGREIGDIQSISYDAAQIQQETQGIDIPPYSSIRRTQLISEWNRAVNTFTPTRLPNRNPTPLKQAEQEKIIYRIDQTIKKATLSGKKTTDKLITNLSNLRDNFANATDYRGFINQERISYEKKSKHPDRSSYLTLLKDIQKELSNNKDKFKSHEKEKIRFFKPKTTHLFAGIEKITLTTMELKIDEALMKVSRQNIEYNSEIVDFLENNELVTKLLQKAQTLENQGSDESRLKGKSIRLILEESKLIGSFTSLNTYLDTIKNANQVIEEMDTPSFYQETLNRPRGIIDKILRYFGWQVKTETAKYFDKLIDAVARKMEIENRLNI
jgi:hypothetical protein